MKPKILSFGEILWDVINDQEYIGGAPFNLAAHLAKLNSTSYLVSRVGDDRRGKKAVKEVENLGVKKKLIQKDDNHPTGWVDVTLDEDGSPSYILHEDVAYDFVEYNDKIEKMLNEQIFDVFCFGTLGQRNETSRRTLNKILDNIDSKEIFLDINLRKQYFNENIIRDSLESATILKLNDEEVIVLAELLFNRKMPEKEFVNIISQRFELPLICITKGEKGCSVFYDQKLKHITAVEVEVADTVGAGDGFSAGFLYHICQHNDPFTSAHHGNYLGAYVASRDGAIPEYNQKIREYMGL